MSEKVVNWRLTLFLLLPISLIFYVSYFTFQGVRPSILFSNESEGKKDIDGLAKARIAVCLVGGARRFELTGPSIIRNVLKVYPNSDLYLHSPLDSNAYKLSLLKDAPRIAAVKIFRPKSIPVTDSQLRVLDGGGSPDGIQRLLQYFNLVEGCLNMINNHQKKNNFTYDWIIRTRVDGYWSNALGPENFVPGYYVVPSGSSYYGLNDRLGIGELNTSITGLSRLSLIPMIDAAGIRKANSETAFKAQLTTQNVKYVETRFPFCVITDHRYPFPPRDHIGVPVASISSPGPLSGTKCRVCEPICKGFCVGRIMSKLPQRWSWTEWSNNSLELCDAHGAWEVGWERIFDKVAGKKLTVERKRIKELSLKECIFDFEQMRNRTTTQWEAPAMVEICRLGLVSV